MGVKGNEGLRILIDLFKLPITVEEFEKKLAPIYQEMFPQCKFLPGKGKKNQDYTK